MATYHLYRDTVHGIQAQAGGPIEAFRLIQNACIERNIPAPTFGQIELVKRNVPDLRHPSRRRCPVCSKPAGALIIYI